MSPTSLARLIAAGFSALLVGVGLGRFGYPPLIPAMVEAGWLDADGARFAAAANLAGYGVGAVLAAALIRSLGASRALALGLMGGVAAFLFSTVPQTAAVFAALRALSGLCGGILMIAIPPLVASVVPPQWRGRANGFVFTGLGAGFLLSGTLVPALAQTSVRLAWWGVTLVIVLAAFIAWIYRPHASLATAGQKPACFNRMDLRFVGLLCIYGGPAIGYVPHTTFFVDYVARDLGFGLSAGGLMWVMAGVTAFVGPLAGGFVSETIGFRAALRLGVAAMALGALMPVLSHHWLVLTLSVMMGGGLMPVCASFAAGRTRDIVGGEAHAPAWGFVTAIYSVLQALGAYGLSWLLSISQSYNLVFGIASAIIALGLAADLMLCALHNRKAG